MNFWFTADTHFGHENIIKYADRPFKTLKEMDDKIVDRFNERIKSDDTVFFLGDFCFKGKNIVNDYLKKLNGN